MAIRRNKLDRKVDLTLDSGRVVDMPPGWTFVIDCPHHGKIEFDFRPFQKNGRDDVAGHMRDAVWSMRHTSVGATLYSYLNVGLRPFWRFLEDPASAGEKIKSLGQIDRALLDRYLAWLELQLVAGGKNKGEPWSIASRRVTFNLIKTLLINRQKSGAAVSKDLNFPRNPFPNANRLSKKREAYSITEQKRVLAALNQDLRNIHENRAVLTGLQVLAVHLVLLALTTGRNMQSLLDMKRDSLQEHPLPDRELMVTYKRRGWSTQATSLRKTAAPAVQKSLQAIPATIGEHFRALCAITAPLIHEIEPKHQSYVFILRITHLERKGQVVRLDNGLANAGLRMFVQRHSLQDDHGQALALNIARLRPTFATELYRRTRDIRRVQQALGHANVETTARHYAEASLDADRDHALVVDGMVSQFSRMEVEGKILLAADGKIPLGDMKDLLAGGYNTGIARCKNPFREDESVCQKFFHCFKCPNMCVFEDDLWRLFSFYYRLLAERSKVNSAHWLKTYGPIIRRIDTDIASQFPIDKVNAARLKAQQTPHPTWKGPLL
ncbi:tyrosine-type recombinase/integrase [Herminiimonas contaminans]|uniref:Tyrosine-type recombinase/integrase n=1 Tax=Herminiimonas contaminans TaxID=1111140 RepID=A0ABS0EYM8_9BURK|nr:tyrosine-type recombinase/integrase [Herminiimonas contaminans]MBF8179763.1 tyrosine-type recombinase/integrase [Herminiimonas contaminans]